MGNYTVIAEAGNALVRLLRRELTPKLIPDGGAIGLASPAERGDLMLCIHLYDIGESADFHVSGMVADGVDRQKFPPVYLNLFYLIAAFSASDVKFRSEEEQRVLGRVIQVMRDFPMLNPDTMEFASGVGREGVRIGFQKLEAEEKQKIWTFPGLPPKLSLFYRLGPLPLESARTREIQRVRSVRFRTEEKGEGV